MRRAQGFYPGTAVRGIALKFFCVDDIDCVDCGGVGGPAFLQCIRWRSTMMLVLQI